MNQEYAIEFNHVSKIYTLKSKDKKHKEDQRFYDLMSHILPDWRERKQKLNEKV